MAARENSRTEIGNAELPERKYLRPPLIIDQSPSDRIILGIFVYNSCNTIKHSETTV